MIAVAMLALAPAVAPAPASIPNAPLIAPPLDRPLRLVTEETRADGRDARRYRLERTLRFTSEPGGFRVAMTLETATADGDEPRRRAFVDAHADQIGKPVVIHLDRHGALIGVDDVATVWNRWASSLTAAMGLDPAKREQAAALMAQVDHLGPAERQRLIASAVTSLVATADERVPAPPRPANVTATGTTLTGTLLTAAESNIVASRLSAQTDASTPVRMTLISERRVDPALGLAIGQRRTERRTTTTGRSLLTEISTSLIIG